MRKRIYYTILWITTCVSLYGSSIKDKYRWPDFDTSWGKGDNYLDEYYKGFMISLKESYTNWGGPDFFSSKEVYDFINFCRGLYEKDIVEGSSLGNITRIPRIVHQVWLGSRLPEKYKQWQKVWQSLPGWRYRLWTDESIKQLDLINRDIYEISKNYGQRSDIARIEILNKFGGLYVDIDFECINPQFFTMLNKNYDFYAGFEPLDILKISISNALIGSIPGHPILKGYIKELRNRWHVQRSALRRQIKDPKRALNFAQAVVFKTGPEFLTWIAQKYSSTRYRDIFLPPTFFYPLGYYYRETLTQQLSEGALKKNILKPESAAIHWWGGSWHQASAFVHD